jgi:ATP-dependent DNA helicase RecQ
MADTEYHRIRQILDYLVEQEYLALEGREYPVLTATPRSGEIVFEKKSLAMMLGRERRPQGELAVKPREEKLFGVLKELRKTLAEAAHVPAYVIFSDASLRDMCRKLPLTAKAFREVSGVGEVKTEKYGAAFTGLIREHINGL